MAGAGKLVGKKELAAILGKTIQTLTVWQAEGMPFEEANGVGTANRYNTVKVIAWMFARETGRVDPNNEKASLLREQAEREKRRNARERGELIVLADAKTVVQRAAFAIRQKIITSGLPRDSQQAIITDIQSLREVDFTKIEETEEEGGTE